MAKKKVRKIAARKEGEALQAGSSGSSGSSATSAGQAEGAGAVPAAVASGPVGRLVEYLKEVKVEFGKVTWASRKDTVGTTVAVLAISFFFAVFLGLSDYILSKLIGSLIY